MRDLWYKNAIIYSLDVETFSDANGDGIGDFEGLTNRLDYLAGIGINCLWLLPFYPTPNKDNGYDVTDYYNVDRRLGTLGDFVEFTRQARERGIRILIDLVVNHTSNQHPWFQAALADKGSPFRDYFLWRDEKPSNADSGLLFPGVQSSTWTYDEQADAYYFHRFYRHQPDLNITNPAVRREITKIMGFWLELGVSGFRVDAAPYLIELPRDADVSRDPFEYLEEFREFLSWRRGDAILIAEANVSLDRVAQYVAHGNRMHLLFNFLANQHLFLSMARADARPLIDALRNLPPLPATGQWANFVRNHDELTLDKLDEAARQEVFEAFGPEPHMQIYDRGIRRRLPPMVSGDQDRMALAYSLMFSLPGTPVLRYGEEIGMGDDLSLPERSSVRTPMQWSGQRNGGFSTAPSAELVRPVIDSGPYAFDKVNVATQRRDPNSFLNRIERMVRARRERPEFGWGNCHVIDTGSPAVLALCYEWEGRVVFAVHNLSAESVAVTLDLGSEHAQHLTDILSDEPYAAEEGGHRVELERYGFRWLGLGSPMR